MIARAAGAAGDSLIPGEFVLTRDDFQKISRMIYADAGINLSEGKAALVYGRLAKRLRALKLQAFRDYCELVASPEGEGERQEMLTSLTTNVTKFYREPHHFEHLKTRVLGPAKAARRGRVRLWSAACSTGQEPYSMAMTLLSCWPEAFNQDVKILATDIDRNVIATAEAGDYDEAQMKGVTPDARRKFFEPAGEGRFRVTDAVRCLVSFRRLNLLEDWPMKGQFAAIFCRNVVIYFDEATQQTLWEKFAPRLSPEGALYIGHSERVTGPATAKLRADGVSTYKLMAGRDK
jgi:chemotaxis protein methyltransferase CheR